MKIRSFTICALICIYTSLISANAYADVKDCQGTEFNSIDFNAIVNDIKLGYTALNNKEIFSCIVTVINLSATDSPDITLLPTLDEPENAIVLCNYFYGIYSVDRPVHISACQNKTTKEYYLRMVSFLDLNDIGEGE